MKFSGRPYSIKPGFFIIEIPMRMFSLQPKMNMWVLASLNFVSMWQLKNKLYTHKIAMRICSHQPKMNIRLFHVSTEKKLYTHEIVPRFEL